MNMIETLVNAWEQDYLHKTCLSDQEYNELSHVASNAQNTLKEKLSKEDFEQAAEVIEAITSVDMRNVHLAYREGIKGGIRLVMEAIF